MSTKRRRAVLAEAGDAIAASTVRTGTSDRSLPAVNAIGVRGELVRILRQAMWNGTLKPGERLLESQLSQELGVSRPPLREALMVLKGDGLVRSVRNRGTFVRVLSARDVEELCTFEIALESLAARLIIESGDGPRCADELGQRLAEVEEAVKSVPMAERIACDFEFHRALVRLGGNGRVLAAWERLVGELRLALSIVDPVYFEEAFLDTTHRPIVEGIQRGDVDAAVRGINDVILPVRATLVRQWSELNEELQ